MVAQHSSAWRQNLVRAALFLIALGLAFTAGIAYWRFSNVGVLNVRDFGAKGDGSTDDTIAIQRAINHAAKDGQTVVFPGGVYSVRPHAMHPDEAGQNSICFQMMSHMHLQGQAGVIIKLADGQSTDANPRCIAMFFSNEHLGNISFRDLVLDMNGRRNPISPRRNEGKYNLFTQAHILFSGGNAAGANDVIVERCKFINTSGVTCIGMAQTNRRNTKLGKNWRIRDCSFHNNGSDTIDHSSIYAWAENVECSGCTFSADTMVSEIGVGALVAYEVHGANQKFFNNLVSNYYQGVWVATNATADTRYIVIADNIFAPLRAVGVDFYRRTPGAPRIHQVSIRNNVFELSDEPIKAELKAAVQIACALAVERVQITGNQGIKTGENQGSAFVGITTQEILNEEHNDITITDNRASGFVCGVWLSSGSGSGLGSIEINNNAFFDLAPSRTFVHSVGVNTLMRYPDRAIARLSIVGNYIGAVQQAQSIDYGMYFSGPIRSLHISGQRFNKIAIKEIDDHSLVVTERTP